MSVTVEIIKTIIIMDGVATLPHFDTVKHSQVKLQWANRRVVVGDGSAGGGMGAEIGPEELYHVDEVSASYYCHCASVWETMGAGLGHLHTLVAESILMSATSEVLHFWQ